MMFYGKNAQIMMILLVLETKIKLKSEAKYDVCLTCERKCWVCFKNICKKLIEGVNILFKKMFCSSCIIYRNFFSVFLV